MGRQVMPCMRGDGDSTPRAGAPDRMGAQCCQPKAKHQEEAAIGPVAIAGSCMDGIRDVHASSRQRHSRWSLKKGGRRPRLWSVAGRWVKGMGQLGMSA